MNYVYHSFRNAETIFINDHRYRPLWDEITNTLSSITDEDIINAFDNDNHSGKKSISASLNSLIRERLVLLGWNSESSIFSDPIYNSPRGKWRLDFAKEEISIEVSFNHGEAIAWNLIKPVLAGELNHVSKAIQTSAGVIITATEGMKRAGNFDSATGSYEKFLTYLSPFQNILTIPMMIVGIEPPNTFEVDRRRKAIVRI